MWKRIYEKLKGKHLNPFAPGQHEGLCDPLTDAPYCVIRDGGQIPSLQSPRLGQQVIDIIVFVPLSSYIVVEPYMQQVREALREIPSLRKTGSETPAIVDDDVRAYTASMEYIVIKRLE